MTLVTFSITDDLGPSFFKLNNWASINEAPQMARSYSIKVRKISRFPSNTEECLVSLMTLQYWTNIKQICAIWISHISTYKQQAIDTRTIHSVCSSILIFCFNAYLLSIFLSPWMHISLPSCPPIILSSWGTSCNTDTKYWS